MRGSKGKNGSVARCRVGAHIFSYRFLPLPFHFTEGFKFAAQMVRPAVETDGVIKRLAYAGDNHRIHGDEAKAK